MLNNVIQKNFIYNIKLSIEYLMWPYEKLITIR